MAALDRAEAWAKAPTWLLSFSRSQLAPPDSGEHHRGAEKAEQAEPGIKVSVKVHTRNGAEEAHGQGAAKDEGIGGVVETVVQKADLL